MAAMFPSQVSAPQVGTYFVGQYYHILQEQPSLVFQFYTDASTMVRIDADAAPQTAAGMLQIHALIMALNFTGIEIKTAHSLDSWNGGVLVMVSGFVQTKDYNARRNFVQTFFLAPQEKGYFVLNDIFHLLDEEHVHQHSASILAQSNYESNLIAQSQKTEQGISNYENNFAASNPIEEQGISNYEGNFTMPNQLSEHGINNYESNFTGPNPLAEQIIGNYKNNLVLSNPITEQASDFMLGQEIHVRDYAAPVHTDEDNTIDKYSIPELQDPILNSDSRVDETPAEEPAPSFPSTINMARDPSPVSAEEPVGEQPKKTYASILRLAKAQSFNPAPKAASVTKVTPVASDRNQAPQSAPQQLYSGLSTGAEKTNADVVEEVSTLEAEGEEKSVYVGNLPSSITESDLEQEFKNFGRIKPNGVAIRSRKESGGYYAFVEFEDVIGVKNALKASPIIVNKWQIYVEERRPNSGLTRGGRRGRGRGGYQSEAPRGRGGRGFGRVGGQDNDREYNSRTRANGIQRHPRQERGILGNHATRNMQSSEATH